MHLIRCCFLHLEIVYRQKFIDSHLKTSIIRTDVCDCQCFSNGILLIVRTNIHCVHLYTKVELSNGLKYCIAYVNKCPIQISDHHGWFLFFLLSITFQGLQFWVPPGKFRITSALVRPFGHIPHFIRAIHLSFHISYFSTQMSFSYYFFYLSVLMRRTFRGHRFGVNLLWSIVRGVAILGEHYS